MGGMVFANQFEMALVADIYNCLFGGGVTVFMAMFWCVFMLM